MFISLRLRHIIRVTTVIGLALLVTAAVIVGVRASTTTAPKEGGFIKWVDFNASYDAMEQALKLDIETHKPDYDKTKLNFVDMLAYLATKYGGDFKKFKSSDLVALKEKLDSGSTMEELTKNMKYFSFYMESYTAILGEFVGEYKIEVADESSPTGKKWVTKYGLKVFSPIAKNFPFSHYDDFGISRSYGYKRKHLGNDLIGQVGTPIIAIEGGIVEAMGWNMYGGWRIGIRSFDGKRYYYYAHLRKNFPYHKSLQVGSTVKAGDVIGYLGRTGYSRTENTNNIESPHLHFGLQLIFDESQREGPTEIWIDVYNIVKLLQKNRSETIKNPETKDYSRVYEMEPPNAPAAEPEEET